MKVYKYRGIESDIFERDLATFQNNQFFAPKFEMLNDLFEANFNETISSALDVIAKLFSVDAKNVKQQLQEVINLKHKLGIFSISKTCYNEQMWANYASSNRGYCIEYDLEKLKDVTKNHDFSVQLEVSYSDDIPTLNLADIQKKLLLQKMYGSKKKNWRHEEEIRLIFDNSSLKTHHESAITAIYFGYHANEIIIDNFKEAFKNRNIKFYRITINNQINKLESILIYESKKETKYDISKYNYEILKHQDNSIVENYYVYLKDSLTRENLKDFVFAFREKYSYKPTNLSIFNTSEIVGLIDIYPLQGKDYIRYADALVALADFSTDDVLLDYPYKDFYYKEQLKAVEQT